MIIGIDISAIPYGTGVSNYTLNLVKTLVKIDTNNTYKLFYSSLRQPLPIEIKQLKSSPNVRIYHYHIPPTILETIWNYFHILPIEALIGKCDVFHTWDWTQPPTISAKTVTTIHDFVPFLYPETQHQKTISTFKRKLRWAAMECNHFICVSQNTKNDLLKIFPNIDHSKISVIYEAADTKYDQYYKLSNTEKLSKQKVISQQYGLNKYVLAQGTREPRKNLDRLITAFNLYLSKHPQTNVVLAISGKYGWGSDVDTKINSHIKILGYIPEKDIVALHAKAICLAYPSLYEGFGLPIVKSMKVGTPVITSNLSSMPEVAGNAAILVDPLDVNQIAQALEKILTSANLRKALAKKGIEQSKKFSWENTAALTLVEYEKLLS